MCIASITDCQLLAPITCWQIARIISPNYKWKNLNPYEVLMLDTDATPEDVKGRYRKLSTLVHPDKRQGIADAREAFEVRAHSV